MPIAGATPGESGKQWIPQSFLGKKEDGRLTFKERFERNWVAEPYFGCWLWIGEIAAKGYGRIWKHSGLRSRRAHRAAWLLYRGQIPDGLHVLHRCDTRLCVNPEHLFLGTNLDNVLDAMSKGRIVASFTPGDVLAIRASTAPTAMLASLYGCAESTVEDARSGATYYYV